MKTKEEILKEHFDKKGITNDHIHVAAYLSVLDAMDEYAENKVKNLDLPHVSKSVWNEGDGSVCNCIDYYRKSYYDKNNVKKCNTCNKPIQLQTDC